MDALGLDALGLDASRWCQLVGMLAMVGGLVWSLGFHCLRWVRCRREERDIAAWLRQYDETQNRRTS